MALLLQRWEGVTVFAKTTAPIPDVHFGFAQKYFLYHQHTLILGMGTDHKRRALQFKPNHTHWVGGGDPSQLPLIKVHPLHQLALPIFTIPIILSNIEWMAAVIKHI